MRIKYLVGNMLNSLLEFYNYCFIFIIHSLNKFCRFKSTRSHSFCPAFTEETGHGRFISQRKLSSILEKKKKKSKFIASIRQRKNQELNILNNFTRLDNMLFLLFSIFIFQTLYTSNFIKFKVITTIHM